MKYNIIVNPGYTNAISVGISLSPENEPLKFFISAIKPVNVPLLIERIVASQGYSQEFISLLFYHEMDWEDKADIDITEGEVSVYSYHFGETVLKEQLLNCIMYYYGNKLLDMYQKNPSLPAIWKQNMLHALQNLKEKIASEKSTS